jgi:NAD(P)-dependent dehydrogenase (short-subunit alcohol dehydrogenase family)
MAARLLVEQGHVVSLHARSAKRAVDTRVALPHAEQVLVGDLSSMAETRALAEQANATGSFDAVIHNAGIYIQSERSESVEGTGRSRSVTPVTALTVTPATSS